MFRALVLTALLLATSALAQDEADLVEALLKGTDDVARGESSIATIQMHVKTQRYERTVVMKSFAQGTEKTLIRILSPAKDAGIATLKVDDNLWNYLPKVDRTMKVPSGMMSGSWMGSHLTNDDLVRESRLSEDYTWTIDQRGVEGGNNWVISLIPKPETPVVWGKVTTEIRPDKIPVSIRYYDEKGVLVRTMAWFDVKEVDGRQMPTRMRIEPADKPDEFTEVTYGDLDFDADIPAATFTLQALRK